MRTRMLMKELVLVFLFTKYNIAPLSTTTKIFKGCDADEYDHGEASFDIALIMYTSVLQLHGAGQRMYSFNDGETSLNPVILHREDRMGQARECIHSMVAKLVLILLSFIMKICLNQGDDLSSTDIVTCLLEPFIDATMRSMSVRLEQLTLPNC